MLFRSSDGMVAAVVLATAPKSIRALLASGEEITIPENGLGQAASSLTDKVPANKRIRRGAIIRVMQEGQGWAIIQLPEVESAFVSASAEDGAIRALVGGFDFSRNKFNHVTQAWRQPGSSFKPFIYSASLEKGLSPGTIINDAVAGTMSVNLKGVEMGTSNYTMAMGSYVDTIDPSTVDGFELIPKSTLSVIYGSFNQLESILLRGNNLLKVTAVDEVALAEIGRAHV